MWQAGRIQHVIEAVEAQACKVQLLADFFYHLCIFWCIRVAVLLQGFFTYIVAFKLLYNAACNQIHFAL